MAKKSKKKFGLTVAGKGEYVDARSFDETLHDTLDLLREVDRGVSGLESGTTEWEVVEASVKSPLFIGLAARAIVVADYSDQIVDTTLRGIEMLGEQAAVPPGFSPKALAAAKRITDHYENGVLKIQFASATKTVVPMRSVSENVSRIINQAAAPTEPQKPYTEHGTVEGKIENLIGTEHYFSLYDVISGKRLKCTFAEVMREEVRTGWQKRVIVEGLIYYGGDGKAERVAATSLTIKPDRSLLPQFKGKYINITGGIESSTYVRGMRDDD